MAETNSKQFHLFYLSQSFSAMYFWVAIAVPYLSYRGLQVEQIFTLLSIYNLFGLFLEYPTGVFGDRFGYKRALILSNILIFVSMIVMMQSGGFLTYLLGIFLLAIGNGFYSGNNMGLLKQISQHIKRDTANFSSWINIMFFISSIVGGYLATISFHAAFYISSLCMLLAIIPLWFIHIKKQNEIHQPSILQIAKTGIRFSATHPVVRKLLLTSALFGGYLFSIKTIVGSFNLEFNLATANIGLIIGFCGLSQAIGNKLYAYWQKDHIKELGIGIALLTLASGLTHNLTVVLTALFISVIGFGYFFSAIDGEIQELAHDTVRASIFSLKRLLLRFIAFLYLLGYGYTLKIFSFQTAMIMTGTLLIVGTLLLHHSKRK